MSTLDSGPPLPPNLQPQASVGGLSGQPQGGAANIQQVVIPKLMEAEKQLRACAAVMPEFGMLIDQMRQGAARILSQSAQQSSGQASPGVGSLMSGGTSPVS